MNITKEGQEYEETKQWNEAGLAGIHTMFEKALEQMEEYAQEHNYKGSFDIKFDQKPEGYEITLRAFIPSGE